MSTHELNRVPLGNTAARLTVVRPTAALPPNEEEPFERLVTLATTLLDVPKASVNVVDEAPILWLRRAAARLVLPAQRLDLIPDGFWRTVVRTKVPDIVGDASDLRHSPDPLDPGASASWVSIPFFDATGAVLGAMSVADVVPRRWTDRDLEVLTLLAHAAAAEYASMAAMAALRASEHVATELALTLQQSLLPALPPDVPGLDIATRFVPAGRGVQVSGDFYDVFRLPGPRHCALAIGDVSGHGVEAAKVTALARHTIRATAMTGARPHSVLEALNLALLGQEAPQNGSEPRFLTATYAQLRQCDGGAVARVSSAGHCPTLVRRAGGAVEVLSTSGMPLGWFPDPQLQTVNTVLRPGDALVLYTDGVSEARRDNVMLGDEGVSAAVESAPVEADARSLAALVEDAGIVHGGVEPHDDMAVLVVRLLQEQPPRARPRRDRRRPS